MPASSEHNGRASTCNIYLSQSSTGSAAHVPLASLSCSQHLGISMEQEVGRFLFAQLGYNAAADATLSSNCRGNLKGLWEFIISNYKTADSKRHIQHVLDRHRREQEAAARAPEEQREAEARRQRLQQLRSRNAELEQTLTALQVNSTQCSW